MRMLWGGASASSQYEGGFTLFNKGMDTQDCRRYIKRTDNATTSTRLLTKADIERAKNPKDGDFFPGRKGSEGLAHIDEDIEYLSELGIDIYRISVAWSRIFPTGEEEEPNEDALNMYGDILKKLKDKGIKIYLSLTHYALPLALVEKYGGWKNRKLVDLYLKYAKVIFERFGKYLDYVVPFNEINTGFFSPFNGLGLLRDENKEGSGYDLNDIFAGLHNQFIASAKVIELGRKMLDVKFGCMAACFCYYGYSCNPLDQLKTLQYEQVNQWFFTDVLVAGEYPYYMKKYFRENNVKVEFLPGDEELLKNNTADFVGFSYYQSNVCASEEMEKTAGNLVVSTKNPYLKANEWGWQIDPVGMRISMNKIYDRYKKPVMITENSFGYNDVLEGGNIINDDYRIQYLNDHFEQIKLAVDDGVECLAYLLWGIVDIVSAGSLEMTKRYGVVYVDADNLGNGTYKRYKKKSFKFYKDFIEKEKNSVKS